MARGACAVSALRSALGSHSRAEQSTAESSSPVAAPGEKLFSFCHLLSDSAGNGSESWRNTAPLGGNRARQSQALNRHGNTSLLSDPWAEGEVLALASPQLLAGRQGWGLPSGLCSQPTSLPRQLPLKPLREEGLSSEWDRRVQLGSPKHSHELLKFLPAHPHGLLEGENPHSHRLVEVNEGANYPPSADN